MAAASQRAQAHSEIGTVTAPTNNHVIELIHGRKSVVMSKPTTIQDAKKQAKLCFENVLGDVDVEQIQLSFRPSYLSAIIWDDAAWTMIPQGARVRVAVIEKSVPPIRGAASRARASVPATTLPAAIVQNSAQSIIQGRAPSSSTAARQQRIARRTPYTTPTQAETRQINRIIRSFERSYNAVRPNAASTSSSAASTTAAATAPVPTRPAWTSRATLPREDEVDDGRSSAPSPPSVRNDVESRNHHHASDSAMTRLSDNLTTRAIDRRITESVNTPSSTATRPVTATASSPERRAASSTLALSERWRRQQTPPTPSSSSSSTARPSISTTPASTSRSFLPSQPVASSSASPSRSAVTRRQAEVASSDPTPSSVVTPPADAIALYLPAALEPVTKIKLRAGSTYLQPVSQEIWTFDNLEPNFRFRSVRERIARMRGSIPGRTRLTYRGIELQDHWIAAEVNMRDGDTIFYFFEQTRVHVRSSLTATSSTSV